MKQRDEFEQVCWEMLYFYKRHGVFPAKLLLLEGPFLDAFFNSYAGRGGNTYFLGFDFFISVDEKGRSFKELGTSIDVLKATHAILVNSGSYVAADVSFILTKKVD